MTRIQLQLHTGCEEREPFEQPLDVRVSAFETFEPETRGDSRVRLRELRAHFPRELQLAVVVLEEARIHYAPPLSEIEKSPESVLILVRSTRCCGMGWPHNCASMRRYRW